MVSSDDINVKSFGSSYGLTIIGLVDCPLPPEKDDPPLLKIIENAKHNRAEVVTEP